MTGSAELNTVLAWVGLIAIACLMYFGGAMLFNFVARMRAEKRMKEVRNLVTRKVQWVGQMTDGRVVRAIDPLPDDPPPLGKRWLRAWRCTPGYKCDAPANVTCTCKAAP